MTPQEAQDAIHELRLQVAELERRNAELREERERAPAELRTLANAMRQVPASVVITNHAGDIEYISSEFEAVTGYTRAEVLGRNPRILKSGLTPAEVHDSLWKTIAAGGEWRGELCNKKKNGDVYWELATIAGLKDESGQPAGYIAVKQDITELVRTREALKLSEERYRALIDCSLDAIAVHRAGKIVYVNAVAVAMLGARTRSDLVGKPILEVVHPDFHEVSMERARQVAEGSPIPLLEAKYLRLDGSVIEVETLGNSIVYDGAQANHVSVRDITERKQAERVQAFLAQGDGRAPSEPFLRSLARFLAQTLEMELVCIDRLGEDGLSPRALVVWRDGGFLDVDSRASKDTPCGDSTGKTTCWFPAHAHLRGAKDHVHTDVHAACCAGVTLWSQTGRPIGLITLNGDMPLARLQRVEATLKMVAGRAAGELERLRVEESLQLSERSYRSQFANNTSVMLLIASEDGSLLDANAAAERFYGYTRAQLLGMGITDLNTMPAEEVGGVLASVPAATGGTFEFQHRLADGSIRQVEVSASRIQLGERDVIHSIVHDITARRRAEEEKCALEAQLQQAQRMESVGQLAGGVAHDFNNMLAVILGTTDMAMEEMDASLPLYADLVEIRTAASRSADLTRQLLAFARKQTIAPKVLDLDTAIVDLLKMLRRLIGENVALEHQPGTSVWPVLVDPSQVDQVLTNLCVNARDAIPGVGRVIIETGNCTFDLVYCAAHPGHLPGDYVRLSVTDSGQGMDPETRARIFEPFFTTKAQGKGTGLGLATVYGVVAQNQGFITVSTEVGKGSTFNIFLPRDTGSAELAPRVAGEQPPSRAVVGRETILLVDDEPAVLSAARRILQKEGYAVLPAVSPTEALQFAREHVGEIHLLVTDVIMPEMNGRDLADQVHCLRPDIGRLFISGYTAEVVAQHDWLNPGVNFLPKPFSSQDLAARVRGALEQARSTRVP